MAKAIAIVKLKLQYEEQHHGGVHLGILQFTEKLFASCPQSIHQMRRDLLLFKRTRDHRAGEVKKMLRKMLRGLKVLKYNKNTLKRNLLTNSLLKFNSVLMEWPCCSESELHKLFELWVNCVRLNFQNFVCKDGMKWHIIAICEYICDLIMANSNRGLTHGAQPAYMKYIQGHKITYEITICPNRERVQTSLYYLVQMVSILLQGCNKELVVEWSRTERLKLQGFVVFNGDSHLATLFINKTRRLVEGFSNLDNFQN